LSDWNSLPRIVSNLPLSLPDGRLRRDISRIIGPSCCPSLFDRGHSSILQWTTASPLLCRAGSVVRRDLNLLFASASSMVAPFHHLLVIFHAFVLVCSDISCLPDLLKNLLVMSCCLFINSLTTDRNDPSHMSSCHKVWGIFL
jgi:hypothetical protein